MPDMKNEKRQPKNANAALRYRTVLKWGLGAAAVLVIGLLIITILNTQDFFAYPDARSNKTAETQPAAKVFNVRRAKNALSGLNFGLALQPAKEGDYGVVLEETDFDAAQRAGFSYIRVHVGFLHHVSKSGNGYALDPGILKRLDWVIENILSRDMVAIIDWCFMLRDDQLAFRSSQEEKRYEDTFLAVWGSIAERYRDYPEGLYFELMNEPHRPIGGSVWNDYARKAISLIRKSGGNNSTRMIVVGTAMRIGRLIHTWDQVNGIEGLELPSAREDPNIMVTFHYYDPYPFTYQGQTYSRDLKAVSWIWMGNVWSNTDKQIAYVRKDFDTISRWAEKNGRKVMLGEFGVSVHADLNSQIQWTRLVREEAESRGMVWVFWDFYDQDQLGAIYNQKTGAWREEILEALMPEAKWPPKGGDDPGSFIRELIGLTGDPEWIIRKKAAVSLRLSGPEGSAAVPALTRALGDVEWQVRREAARALANFGSASSPAVPALIQALKDEEWQVRQSAIEALAATGEAARSALPELIGFLKDEEWLLRKQAVLAISSIAPEDMDIRGILRSCQDDPENQVRRAVKLALSARRASYLKARP